MEDVKEKLDEVVDTVKDKVEEGLTEKVKKSLYLESKTKGALDAVQEKLVSRKLLVFLTATGLLIGAGLDPDTWGMIAMFYIGGQSAIDTIQIWRHGRQ
jgi:deoxyhypusine synthase